MKDRIEPGVAGLKAATEMAGYDCKVPGMDMTPGAPLMPAATQPDMTPPKEGGATWLGKGSSKPPFPV